MGYDVHITRASEWSESESSPISLEEWIALVAGDAEMRLTGVAEANTPDAVLRYENPGLAIWTRAPHGGIWFDYRRGRIVVKNPDPEILAKMKQIAEKLRAKVIGDEGEEY
jgi:hypothetical protein